METRLNIPIESPKSLALGASVKVRHHGRVLPGIFNGLFTRSGGKHETKLEVEIAPGVPIYVRPRRVRAVA